MKDKKSIALSPKPDSERNEAQSRRFGRGTSSWRLAVLANLAGRCAPMPHWGDTHKVKITRARRRPRPFWDEHEDHHPRQECN